MVQKKFLKCIHYKCTHSQLSYDLLLDKYDLLDLASRRIQLSTMLFYDICHNKYDCIDLIEKICYQVPVKTHIRTTRQHKLFATSICRTNAGVRAPIRRMLELYNFNFNNIDILGLHAGIFMRAIIENLKHKNIQITVT